MYNINSELGIVMNVLLFQEISTHDRIRIDSGHSYRKTASEKSREQSDVHSKTVFCFVST